MKSFIKGGIGKVITDYGTKAMDIAKKGNLGRSLFSFIGSLRADSIQFPELPAPGTPATDKGGVIYVKDDGKPYFKSSTTSETDLTQGGVSGVTSLEGLNGALDLTAGNNISISDNGSDAITIGVTGVVTETTTHIHEQVKNVEGSTIPAGTPVYAIDEVGNSGKVRIGKADASNAAKMPAIGILDTQLVNNAEGTATLIGIFNTNLSGFTGLDEGDIVYVASGGGLTATKPTGSGNLIQNMGIILKTNGTAIQGLQVTCIGRTNDVPNLDSGFIFHGNASNQAVATRFSTLLPAQSLAAITLDGNDKPRMIVKGSALDDTSGSSPTTPNASGSVHTILKGAGWFHTEDVGDRNNVSSLPLNIYTGHGQGTDFDSSGDATLNNSTDVNSGLLTLQSGDLKNTGSGDTTTGNVSIVSGDTADNGSGSHTSGNILIRAGIATGTGDCTAGNVIIEQGFASSFSGTATHGALKLGNAGATTPVEVLNKLKVTSNVIQDNDAVDCITFDSSGNTTIANTLNATLTGNVTGNTSGSSGSCTGNAATATALTAGDKTINGDLTVTSGTSGEATLTIISDTDNNDENDNPFIVFTQDGGAINGYMGLTGDADKWPDGGTLTGATANGLVLGTKGPTSSTNSQLFLTAGDAIRLTILNDGKVGIGTTTPSQALEVSGNIDLTGNIELGNASDTTLARSAAGIATIEGKQIFTTNTPALTSAAAGVPAVTMQIRRTITTAEANALNSTPIELIPAQGANTVIVLAGGMIRIDRAATQTNSAADMNLHYEGLEPGTFAQTALFHARRFMYNETGDRVFNIIPGMSAYEVAQSLTQDVNKAVEVSVDSALTSDCITSIEFYLTYNVFNIS